jgi:hypothetical protein
VAVGIVYAVYLYIKNIISETDIIYSMDVTFLPFFYVAGIICISVLFCVAGTAFSIRRFLRL